MESEKPLVKHHIGWAYYCHNEWCDGPEHFANSEEKEPIPKSCPTCGWLANLSSGIKPIYEYD